MVNFGYSIIFLHLEHLQKHNPGIQFNYIEQQALKIMGVTVRLTAVFGKTVNRTVFHGFLFLKTITVTKPLKTEPRLTAVNGSVTVNCHLKRFMKILSFTN